MNSLRKKLKQRKGIPMAGGAPEDNPYFEDMTLDEFLETAGIAKYKDRFLEQDAEGPQDILEHSRLLLPALSLPAVPHGKLEKAIKLYKKATKKGRNRSNTITRDPSTSAAMAAAGPVGTPPAEDGSQDQALDSALGSTDADNYENPDATPDDDAYVEADLSGGSAAPPRPPKPYEDDNGTYDDPDAHYDGDDAEDYENLDQEEPAPLTDFGQPVSTAGADFGMPTLPGAPGGVLSPTGDLYEDPDAGPIMPQDDYENPDDYVNAEAIVAADGATAAPAVPAVAPRKPRRPESALIEPEQAPLPDDASKWTNGEVIRWLKENDLSDFKDAIYSNGFDGAKLLSLSGSQFAAGGFDKARCNALDAALAGIRKLSRSGTLSRGSAMSPHLEIIDKPKRGRALHEYQTDKKGHLTFKANAIITITDDTEKWWRGKSADGRSGKVPSNFLELIEDDDFDNELWYHGDATRRAIAEQRLNSDTIGAFLVRPSQSTPNGLTLSVRGATSIIHLPIDRSNDKYSLGQNAYDHLYHLIANHETRPIKVQNREEVFLQRACNR